ncbi:MULTISPECIES: TIGR02444 family protein [unclassified Mycobacterium]|uniref:TIGR02444 family protein n=1 Tax=unclassified Mycobacterium TaxID=2642494 RepID=UPI0029C86422|nr:MULTISPECIES: TIGR02444 family protein [unclassified Mycobacterium]
MGEPREDFTAFALDVHAADGVSDAAILLQDRCAADVDVLLFAAFIGAVHGRDFGSQELTTALERVGPWQQDVVAPLRAIRRQLKNGPPPAPTQATIALRERIKQLELDAEMIELAVLAELAGDLGGPAAEVDPTERATVAMTVVIQTSAGREPTSEEHAAIQLIARAAAQHAGRS